MGPCDLVSRLPTASWQQPDSTCAVDYKNETDDVPTEPGHFVHV